jgi:hypothetical protein
MKTVRNFELVGDCDTDGTPTSGWAMRIRLKSRLRHLSLPCGAGDDIHAFREGDHLYVLALNRRLPYVGLNTFELDGHDNGAYIPASDRFGSDQKWQPSRSTGVFLQSEADLVGTFGHHGFDDLSPLQIVRKMADLASELAG